MKHIQNDEFIDFVDKRREYKDIFCTHEYNLRDYLTHGFPYDKRVLFFDDSIIHANDVYRKCPGDVCSVYVPSKHCFSLNMDSVDESVLDYGENVYVKEIENDVDSDPHEDDGYKTNGISKRFSTIADPLIILPSCVDRIYDWVDKSDVLENRVVFFDWDYVLNQHNGFVLVQNYTENSYLRLLNDTLYYLIGGAERLRVIQNMLQHLLDNKIKIFILTSNGNANQSAAKVRRQFVELLQVLFKYRYFQDRHLIYASSGHSFGAKSSAINRILRGEASLPFLETPIIDFSVGRKRSNTYGC
jgi:hypothetical protein